MAFAEPWTEPGAEPEPEPEPEDHAFDATLMPGNVTANTEAFVAPSNTATNEEIWGIWWPLHRYGFATLFTILSVYALYATILRIMRNRATTGGMRSRKAVQPVFTCINLLVFLLGFSNSIVLFFDAYRLYGGLPFVMSVILSNMPYPCMTSAFALVNWVLISISQMRITRASKLRSVSFLTLVILAHFLLVIGASLVLVYLFPVLVLGLACHSFFVVWGVLQCLTYIYSAWKIMVVDKTNRKTLHDISIRDGSVHGTANISAQSKYGFKLPCKIPKGLSSMFSKRKMQSNDEKAIFTVAQHEISSQYENKITEIDNVSDDNTKTRNEKEISSDALKFQQNGRKEQDQQERNDQKTQTQYVENVDVHVLKTAKSDTSEKQNGVEHGASSPSFGRRNGRKTNERNTKQMDKQRDKMGNKSAGKMSGTGRPQNSTRKVFRISAVTAVLGVAASGLGLYGILTLMVAIPENRLSGWPWLTYQTVFRLVELGMGCTMAYFTTQPFPRRRQR